VKVEEILRLKGRSVRVVQPWTPIGAAVRKLKEPSPLGALVVTGVEHGFTGVLSERDVVGALHRYGMSALEMRVEEAMSRHVPTCSPGENINAVMARISRTRYRHVPVLDGRDLAGIVSIGDLVAAKLGDMRLETDVLRDLYLGASAR
jgi:CBS domain-containing protein